MPNSEEGLIFGDFTAEEWEKYFSSSAAQIGNSRAVEFLFDFEYSDPDEPDKLNTCKESDARGQSLYSDSAGAKNVPVGLEDSGVEVGQESEQESAPGKTVKFADDAKNSSDNVPHEKQKQEPPGQGNQRNNEVIEFGGKSIVEQTIPETNKGKPASPSSAASRDEDSFPPLSSTVTDKQGEKPENERSRKRRKRRRQRKRSGSVSSSSSECNENERHSSNSPGSIAKSKTTCSLMTAEKVKADKDTTKVHVNVLYSTHKEHNGSVNSMDKKTESPRNSTSSCDGKTFNERKSSSSTDGTLNSPVQSDTDVKVTLNVSLESCSPDKNKALVQENEGLQISADQNKTPSDAHQQVLVNKEPPKLSSWADLFKSSSKPSPGIVIKVQSPVSFIRTETPAGLGSKKTEDPVAQTIVGIEEDKYAKRFAETIQKQQLNYRQKALIPRGLTNRGNWCYINATLQALVGCPPFFNLLRRLPFIKERGPTSTPILDSLISYMNEFKELVTKPANSSTAPKTEFKIDEPFEPSYVYRMLTATQSSLSVKGRQEDAQEFLSCILNGVHEEMLRLSNLVSKPGNESETSEALTEAHSDTYDDQTAELQEDDGDWEEVGPRNRSMVTRMASYPRSLISDIFGGFLRSSVHQAGLKDSANVEPFFELQLDVQTVTSVEDALKNLALKEEVQGYTCTKTNVQVDISRRVSLEGLPKVLILHLKRFIYSKSGSQKLQKVIDYPLELTMGKELLSPNVKNKYSAAQKTYKLFAVVYHHGKNAWGGHYTSDVYHPVYGWIRADDTRLKTVPSNYVLKPTQGKDPYMLFYRRTDLMP